MLALSRLNKVNFIIIGVEVGSQARRVHLQGFMQFEDPIAVKTVVRRVLEENHLNIAIQRSMGTAQKNIDYCSKDGLVI